MSNIFLKNKHRFVQTQKNMASVNHRYFLGKRKEIPKRFFLKTLVFHTYQDTEVYVCLFVRFQFCPSPQKKLYFVNRSNYLSKINKLPNTIPPPLLVFFWYFAHRYSLGILAIFVRLWVGREPWERAENYFLVLFFRETLLSWEWWKNTYSSLQIKILKIAGERWEWKEKPLCFFHRLIINKENFDQLIRIDR